MAIGNILADRLRSRGDSHASNVFHMTNALASPSFEGLNDYSEATIGQYATYLWQFLFHRLIVLQALCDDDSTDFLRCICWSKLEYGWEQR